MPLIFILSSALLALGCDESGTPDGSCLDCADAGPDSDAGADVGVDATEMDATEPPVVEGAQTCPEDGPLDFTLRTVVLSGNLDLDGRNADAVFRPEWAQNAYVEATDVHTGRRLRGPVDLDGNYAVELFASTYDLVVRFDEEWCLGACSYVPLVSDFDVFEDSNFDDRVEIVLHTVSLTLDGDPQVPANDDRVGRGYLDYIDVETNRVIRRPLNTARPASGRSWIPKDRVYDLYWTTEQIRAQEPGEAAAILPVGSSLLGQVDTREGGGDSYVVDSIVLDAELLIAGATMPDDGILNGVGRGRLTVNSLGGMSSPLLADVGETGPAMVQMRVFPGQHSAMLQPHSDDQQDVLDSWATLAACGLTDDPCEWTESGSVGLDFVSVYGGESAGSVDVSGTLSFVDESGVPIELGDECGSAQVAFLQAGTSDYAAIASAESGFFETAMTEGPKDIWVLSGWDSDCFIGGSLVAEGVSIGSADLSLEATLVSFDTTLLVNGETMLDDTKLDSEGDGRGRLIFTPTGYDPGQTSEILLGESGPAVWEGRILAGEYDVALKTMKVVGRIGEQPMEQDVLPSTTRTLGSVRVDAPDSVTFDLTVLRIHGTVTVDPADTELVELHDEFTRGLNLVSANNGAQTYLPHDEVGSYEGLVYEDSYRIDYIGSGWADYDQRVLAPVLPVGSEMALWRLECGE